MITFYYSYNFKINMTDNRYRILLNINDFYAKSLSAFTKCDCHILIVKPISYKTI